MLYIKIMKVAKSENIKKYGGMVGGLQGIETRKWAGWYDQSIKVGAF